MERLTTRKEERKGSNPYDYWLKNISCDTDIWKVIEKLAQYEDLEEQGLLLKPKCKPGDTVYEINPKRNLIYEHEITSANYEISKTFYYTCLQRDGIASNLHGFFEKNIGETVFLTQADAAARLKGLQASSTFPI